MLESKFQTKVIRRLRSLFPGCVILKNDPNYLQGILDWTILFEDKWAMLEIKASRISREQPNQHYYAEILDDMSFAAFIFPENEEEVLRELQQAFQSRRSSRISKS